MCPTQFFLENEAALPVDGGFLWGFGGTLNSNSPLFQGGGLGGFGEVWGDFEL